MDETDKKAKFKLIEGNPSAKKPRRGKSSPPFIKAAVVGSKYPDIDPVNHNNLTNQTEISRTIEEYRKLVAKDPEDPVLLNALGDLYVRAGKVDMAQNCFQLLAEIFYQQKNLLKALAIYKKIIYLSSSHLEANRRVTEIKAQLGLK